MYVLYTVHYLDNKVFNSLHHVQVSSLNTGPTLLTVSSDTQQSPKRCAIPELPRRHQLYTRTGRCLFICAYISGANQQNQQCYSCGVIAIRVQHVTSAFQLAVCCWHSCRWLTARAIVPNRHRASSAGCVLSVQAPSSSCSVPSGRNGEPVLVLSIPWLDHGLEIGVRFLAAVSAVSWLRRSVFGPSLEAQFRSQTSPCGICEGQIDTVTVFCPGTLAFLIERIPLCLKRSADRFI